MNAPIFHSARPYTRWWWFSGPIDAAVIRAQLDWLAANGFGGVEIAWMYPQDNTRLGAPWLSAAWAEPVRFAAAYAASLGLGCDFTLGSAWPFGGLHVPPADASQTWLGPSAQRLEKSWETPLGVDGGPILNHLDRHALARYARRFGAALGLPVPKIARDEGRGATQNAVASVPIGAAGMSPVPKIARGEGRGATQNPVAFVPIGAAGMSPDKSTLTVQPGFFCDSWEVLPDGLWTDGFGARFQQRYGYDLLPLMADLDAHPAERYDYRKLLAAYALEEFYRPYTALCHELGGYARVQCHGGPADLVAAYALADVPESEAILFDTDFADFAASAAALAGKPVVSAEAFTCVYGWEPCPGPGPHQGEERLSDLKLIADGLLANGVNQIVWHGMPYNPPGGGQRFYATTHVGPDSPLAADFAPFNAYLAQTCTQLRRGRTYTDVAVYLPLEDAWMAGELPVAQQKPSSKYVYELQETKLPGALKGYRPLWVTGHFLRDAAYVAGKLRCGEAAFTWLYVDVTWLDAAALADLLRLAQAGLPLCLVRPPQEPGRSRSPGYAAQVAALLALPTVHADFRQVAVNPPLVEGDDLPDFWCLVDGDVTILFFAHPATQGLRYPLDYDAARGAEPATRQITVNASNGRHAVDLRFAPYQSLLLTVSPADVHIG